ncbi:hypothetical protein MY8738_005944 [Beauveria namnaoensis]
MAGRSTRYEPLDVDEGGVHHRRPSPQKSVFLAPRTRDDWIFVAANAGLFLITVVLWLSGSKSVSSKLECAKVASSYYQGVGVPEEGLVALNKTNGKYLQTNRSTAAKPEYYALVEMFHQLHCLNIIRQATWPTDMYDKGWGEELQPMNVSESQGRAHVDHCVETLRLSLMCFGDVTPMLLLTQDGTLNTSTADFNVHHKCRNYEQIRDFVDASAVDPVIA